jgi:hypothetical protein
MADSFPEVFDSFENLLYRLNSTTFEYLNNFVWTFHRITESKVQNLRISSVCAAEMILVDTRRCPAMLAQAMVSLLLAREGASG